MITITNIQCTVGLKISSLYILVFMNEQDLHLRDLMKKKIFHGIIDGQLKITVCLLDSGNKILMKPGKMLGSSVRNICQLSQINIYPEVS